MKQRNASRAPRRVLLALAAGWIVLQAGAPGLCGAAEVPRPATVSWGESAIQFSIQAGSEFLLSVGGPGFGHRSRGRGTIEFRAQDDDGFPLADGVYGYELREIVTSPEVEAWEAEPDREKREAMRRHFLREDRWPTRMRIQSGTFRVEAGRVVKPPPRPDVADEDNPSKESHEHAHPH